MYRTCICIHIGVEVQYSLDAGQNWSPIQPECGKADDSVGGIDASCEESAGGSLLTSDVYYDWTRVNIKLPYYTR